MKTKDLSLKTILISISIGIWINVLQNAGIIPTKQNVYVQGGYVDTSIIEGNVEIDGTVNIDGTVEVENTVSVSIDEVLGSDGKKYYYNNR